MRLFVDDIIDGGSTFCIISSLTASSDRRSNDSRARDEGEANPGNDPSCLASVFGKVETRSAVLGVAALSGVDTVRNV